MNDDKIIPSFVEALEKVYGKPSCAGFGSAVFYTTSNQNSSLEPIALKDYTFFIGQKWNVETEATWKSAWRMVYERSAGSTADILTELNTIKDADAKRSVPLLTELIENAEEGKVALSAAFNQVDITQLQVYSIGDNEEMAGLLLCGAFTNHSVCSVICLMD